jgi:hypothetical protein
MTQPIIGVEQLALDGGRELTLDLRKITIAEFRFAVDRDSDTTKSDEIVGKAVGMTLEKFQALSQPDYRRVVAAFWKAATQPLEGEPETAVKNSPSESTKD